MTWFIRRINQQLFQVILPFFHRKCFEIPDCKEDSVGRMAECNGGINQEFVFRKDDLTAYAICNPELYMKLTQQNKITFTPKTDEAAKFELIKV